MSRPVYTVPLIPSDLRREETIHRIADALDYIDRIAKDVFSRISNRVAENRRQLKAIDERLTITKLKVDKIRGSSKATKVRDKHLFLDEIGPLSCLN